MSRELLEFVAALEIPEYQFVVQASRQADTAAGRKSDAGDTGAMAGEGPLFFTGLRVPQLDGLVGAPGKGCGPSGENATLVTSFSCPENAVFSVPVSRSQSLAVWSSPPPERAQRPSGEKQTLLTSEVCPVSVHFSLPVARSHSFMVVSPLPERAHAS